MVDFFCRWAYIWSSPDRKYQEDHYEPHCIKNATWQMCDDPHMSVAPFLCRGRPAHPDGGDVVTAAVSGQRRSDHPALLAALSLHQHVALQQAGDRHRFGAVLSLLGGHPPAAAQPHRGLGRETGSGARCRLPPQSDCAGKSVVICLKPCYSRSVNCFHNSQWKLPYQCVPFLLLFKTPWSSVLWWCFSSQTRQ